MAGKDSHAIGFLFTCLFPLLYRSFLVFEVSLAIRPLHISQLQLVQCPQDESWNEVLEESQGSVLQDIGVEKDLLNRNC